MDRLPATVGRVRLPRYPGVATAAGQGLEARYCPLQQVSPPSHTICANQFDRYLELSNHLFEKHDHKNYFDTRNFVFLEYASCRPCSRFLVSVRCLPCSLFLLHVSCLLFLSLSSPVICHRSHVPYPRSSPCPLLPFLCLRSYVSCLLFYFL